MLTSIVRAEGRANELEAGDIEHVQAKKRRTKRWESRQEQTTATAMGHGGGAEQKGAWSPGRGRLGEEARLEEIMAGNSPKWKKTPTINSRDRQSP